MDFLAAMIFQFNNIIAFWRRPSWGHNNNNCKHEKKLRPLAKINITPLALLWLQCSVFVPGKLLHVKQQWNEWEVATYWTKCFLQIQKCLCAKRTLWRSSKHRHNARKTWKCLEFLGIHVYVHYLGGNMKQPLVQTSYKPESATWLHRVTCGESSVTQITQLKSPW